ncbi:MAG: hypothetical protein Q9191_003881 [Dirinaria sp. TL-2023a]
MRVILRHQLLPPVGFDLKGMSLCDIRLLANSISASMGPVNESSADGAPRSHPAGARSSGERASPFAPHNHPEYISVCGTRLKVAGSTGETTLGGVVLVKGNFYGLTVKHVLHDPCPDFERAGGKANEVRIYDSDWAEEPSSDSDSEYDIQDDDRSDEEDEMARSQEIGDSGSWAVDTVTNGLVGMLIAGCRGIKEAYIIPIDDIFTDIKRVMGAESIVELPTVLEPFSSNPDSSGVHALSRDRIESSPYGAFSRELKNLGIIGTKIKEKALIKEPATLAYTQGVVAHMLGHTI